MFVDFNAYFASVEQQARPELRGRPVAVVPVDTDSTCCIAASHEARAYGIKTGTRVGEAKRMCRDLQIVKARPSLYVEYHNAILEAIEQCIPISKICSVDEVDCELMGSERSRERSLIIAQQIKQSIAENVGEYLRCSIGIAPNTFLAKTATEIQKRDGLVVIEKDDLPHCLYGLKLRDLCGIGSRMERRLYLNGIVTVRQLCEASKEHLHQVWGSIEGDRFYNALKGEVVSRPPTQRATLNHSHVLGPELRTEEGAYATLSRLLQKGATRMRDMGYATSSMEVCIKFTDETYWWLKRDFDHTDNTLVLVRELRALWRQNPRRRDEPKKVSITLQHFKPIKECNLSLFEERKAPCEVVDYLNARFGRMKVYLGSAHQARTEAAQPIAFNFVPGLEKRAPARKKTVNGAWDMAAGMREDRDTIYRA